MIQEKYKDELPYEKCLTQGADFLSNTELLAVLLRTGTKGSNVLELADYILSSSCGDSGILMQVNASFFNEFGTRRKALSMLKKGNIHIVGSDCHNLKYRPPKLDKAYAIIKKKLGDDFVTQFNEYGCSLLNTNKTV